MEPLRALVLADEAPFVPLERLLASGDADVVLCLGDLRRADLEPLRDFAGPKLGVHGNHDAGDEFDGLGIEDVHLRRVEVAGLSFGGFSGVHGRRGRYAWTQDDAARRLHGFGHVDVLLAHSPPFGVNDEPGDPLHVGLRGLREYVERECPALLLHGHTYPPLPARRLSATRIAHVRGHARVTLPAPAVSR
ncbi:MAG TPA: metallophosphoesterase [Solirubrobacteraceae bacterium]|nr:metallophosphoesterase [Solirubrobacteraceae bacterium]